MTVPAAVPGAMSFDEACDAIVAYLKDAIPLGYWSVSRYDGDRQLYLSVSDDAYGTSEGDFHLWEDSLCRLMVAGETPQIAPDAMAVPKYATAGVSQSLTIGACVGIPIAGANGELFGTLCGLDPARQSEALNEHAPLLGLLSRLLSTVLAADLARADEARERQRLGVMADTDPLTGLANRRGWERTLESEEQRFRRFGDPGSIIILDLDGLKAVNDRQGHRAGDELIIRAAQTLQQSTRDTDLVARLGGDEFGVLAVNTDEAQTEVLLSRLRQHLDEAGVRCSMGAAAHASRPSFAEVCAAADQAMYADKARRH